MHQIKSYMMNYLKDAINDSSNMDHSLLSVYDSLFGNSYGNSNYVEFSAQVPQQPDFYKHNDVDHTSNSSISASISSVQVKSDSITAYQYFDFIDSIFNSDSKFVSQEVILPGIRFISDTMLIFEKPPTTKPYFYTQAYRESISDETRTQEFYISIPWQVYICVFDPREMRLVNVKMLFAKNSLTSFDDELFAPPLLNFYSNGLLCRPFFESMDDIEKYSKDYSGIMASAYDWVWNSGTNFDITENISYFLKTKKFEQFSKYIPSHSLAFPSYVLLVNNPVYNNPSQLHHKLVKSFFDCYSTVPLEDICNISFNNPSVSDFYYQDNISVSDALSNYAELNGIIVHEQNSDYDDHESGDCPEECYYEEDITSSQEWAAYYASLSSDNNPQTLKSICVSTVNYMKSFDFYKNLSATAACAKTYSIVNNIASQS